MIDVNDVQAGEYELTAVLWDQVTSKPGEVFDFTRHRRGDKVKLTKSEARRLVLAGAVKVEGEEPEVPGQGESVAPGADQEPANPDLLDIKANADVVLKWVGEDKARAAEALAAEQATEKPRTSLVPKLEALAKAGD